MKRGDEMEKGREGENDEEMENGDEMIEFELRPWKETDADALAKYADNKKIADFLRNGFPHPYTREDAVAFIGSVLQAGEETQCCRAIVINGEAAGGLGVFLKEDVYCKNAEVGYWLAEPYWKRGIMSKALSQMCSYTFENYDVVRLFAEPMRTNVGSRKVLENAGFVLEGILKKSVYKNGQFFDACIYALLK